MLPEILQKGFMSFSKIGHHSFISALFWGVYLVLAKGIVRVGIYSKRLLSVLVSVVSEVFGGLFIAMVLPFCQNIANLVVAIVGVFGPSVVIPGVFLLLFVLEVEQDVYIVSVLVGVAI